MKTSLFRFVQSVFFFIFCQSAFASALACFDIHASTGSWSPSLSITNHCGTAVDLQNAIVEFQSNQILSGSFWGDFDTMAYPEQTDISAQANGQGYLIKMPLIFPLGGEGWEPKTTLDDGATIKLQFSATPDLIISSPAIYAMSQPEIKKSKIIFTIPANPTSDSINPEITVTDNSGYSKVLKSISWSTSYVLIDVPYGEYDIKITTLKVGSQSWQGVASPSHVSLTNDNGADVRVSYQKIMSKGQIKVTLNQLAPESSLASAIALNIKNETTGQMLQDVLLAWNQSATITDLNAGQSYSFATTNLQGKNSIYYASFTPANTVSVEADQTKQLSLSFNSQPVETKGVSASIQGLPSGAQADITAVDNYNYQYTTTVQNGDQVLWSLPINRQYQLTAKTVTVDGKSYAASLSPSSFLLDKNQSLTVSVQYQEQSDATQFSPYVDVTLSSITRWDSASSSMQPVGLLDVVKDSGVKSFHLAFITGQSGCKGTWAGYPVSTDDNGFGVPVFKTLKEQGVSLTVAMGGLSGQYLAQVCDNVETLTAAYEQVVSAYNPDVLDFDVENNMQTNNVQLDRMMQAIQAIKANHPNIKISFTLPVMPYGLVAGVGENVIKRAAVNGLSDYVVNIMAMDYGPSFQVKSMGEYAIDAVSNTFKQLKALYPNQSDQTLWHRLGVTPMIGLNDTIPLNFSLADVATLKQFAQQKQLSLLSFWSITRDHPCDNDYVSITCSSNNPATKQANQQIDYQYSLAFMGN